MARYKGFLQSIAQAQREAERQRKAEIRQYTQLARAAELSRKAYDRSRAANQKERARLYAESRAATVAVQNEQLAIQVTTLERILADTLGVDDYFDLETLKKTAQILHAQSFIIFSTDPEQF